MPEIPKTYTLQQIEGRMNWNETVAEFTPEHWIEQYCNPNRSYEAVCWDYMMAYGFDFMAHAPWMIRQLLKMVRHRDSALEEYRKRDESEHNTPMD